MTGGEFLRIAGDWMRLLVPLTLGVAAAKHHSRRPDVPAAAAWRGAGRKARKVVGSVLADRAGWLATASGGDLAAWFVGVVLAPAMWLRAGLHVTGALLARVDEPSVRESHTPTLVVVENAPATAVWSGRLLALAVGLVMLDFGTNPEAANAVSWQAGLFAVYWQLQAAVLVMDPLAGLAARLHSHLKMPATQSQS